MAPFYDFMGNMTRARFAQLEQLFAETEEYELVNAKAMGGLAWVKCRKEGYSCPALFEEVGLIGFSGLHYGANDSCKKTELVVCTHCMFLSYCIIQMFASQWHFQMLSMPFLYRRSDYASQMAHYLSFLPVI